MSIISDTSDIGDVDDMNKKQLITANMIDKQQKTNNERRTTVVKPSLPRQMGGVQHTKDNTQEPSAITTKAVYAINTFYEETNMIYHNIAKKRGLSDSAFDILYALYVEDGQRLSQLCKTSFLSKQTLSSSVKRLEEEGLLRTERQNSRFVQVFLTDAGRERARNFVEPVFEAEVRAVASLTEKEQAALPRFVEHYLGALRKEFAALEDTKG